MEQHQHIVRPVADARAATAHTSWGSLNWLANKALTNSAVTVGRTVIHEGMCNPRHCHPKCEEVLYLLSGRLRHTIGDQEVVLEPGDTIVIPKGVFHNAINIGQGDADMIVVFSSGERDFLLEQDAQAGDKASG